MNPSTTCIDLSVMRELLNNSPAISDRLGVDAHIHQCDRCRQLLFELTAEAEQNTRTQQQSPPDRAGAGAAEQPTSTAKSGSRRKEFEFLDAPRDPGHLGRLESYELIEVVGSGGMGTVFKAFDETLQRTVAVKLMSPELATSDTARRRFIREARAAAQIAHENVVAIHAVNELHRLPFLVMQFVEGCSLQDRINSEFFGVDEIIRVSKEIAGGLAAAHAKGLVHRDIKPANILLESPGNRVKITDFGLARAVDDASISKSGSISGTPLYMSPEQACGDTVDCRSDLFSLGAVMYALCTGQSPFRAGNTSAVLNRVCNDEAAAIQNLNPAIPDWLDSLIGRLLSKVPDDRVQTAAEVANLLASHAHTPRPAVPKANAATAPVIETPAMKSSRRLPIIIGAFAFATAVGVAIVLYVNQQNREKEQAKTTAKAQVSLFGVNLELSGEGTVPNGTENTIRTGFDTLNKLNSLVAKPRYRAPIDDGGPGQMAHDSDGLLAVPFGERVVLMISETGKYVRDVKSENGRVNCVAFSHDGKRLIGGSDAKKDNLFVWDGASGQFLKTLKGHTGTVNSVAFSWSDANLCVSGSDDGSVIVWNISKGVQISRVAHKEPVRAVAFQRESEMVVSGGDDQLVRVQTADGTLFRELKGHTAPILVIAFDAKGTRFATGSDAEVIVWNSADLSTVTSQKTGAGWLAFSPDGLTLYTAAREQHDENPYSVTLWNTKNWEKRKSYRLKSKGGIAVYHLSVDGQLLFANRCSPADDRSEIFPYDATTGQPATDH